MISKKVHQSSPPLKKKKTYDFEVIKLKKLNDFEIRNKKNYIEIINNFTTYNSDVIIVVMTYLLFQNNLKTIPSEKKKKRPLNGKTTLHLETFSLAIPLI